MKKITLLFLLINSFAFGQIIITELADPNNNSSARYVEIHNISGAEVDLTGWELRRWTNGTATPQNSGIDLSSIGTLASGGFALIASNATAFQAAYGFAPDINGGAGGAADSNGDDQIAVFDDMDFTIDIFGVPGEDGSGTCHEFEDGRAERISSITASASMWNEAEWNVWADSAVSGCTNHILGAQDAPGIFDPGSWIGATSDPSLIASTGMSLFLPGTTSVDVTFAVNNFTLDGTNVVEYIVNEGTPQTTTMSPISISTMDGQSYTVTLELKDAGGSLTPQVLKSVNFSVGSITNVSDINTLRGLSNEAFATLTGEAILTFQQNNRNQKYIQDATGAILIDDNAGIITTPYNVGDGITGITGQLSDFNGVSQFIPSSNPGAPTSTSNPVTPQVVSFTELNNNLDAYESEIVQVVGVTFTGLTGGDVFTESTNYTINDETNDLVLRTFNDASIDYVGQNISTDVLDIIGIAGEFNTTSQILPRNLADISSSVLSISEFNAETNDFTFFPNPVIDSFITFQGTNAQMGIKIFNILGAQVLEQKLKNSTVNISGLPTGIYLVQLFEESRKLATKKLIVK